MLKEKFESHRQLQDRCNELIKNKENVCQSIIDYANSMEFLTRFRLFTDYIYQEDNEIDENFGMWKVGHDETVM